MKKHLSITAALLMASAACSFANAENFKPMTFAQHDTNGDGVLSKEEVRGRLLSNFNEFDIDANGTLSEQEFAAVKMNKQGKRPKLSTFSDLDSNSDGVLSKDEFAALKQHRKHHSCREHKRPNFQDMDKNSDGVLSKDEVGGRLLAHFAEFDTDANGTLSAEEFAAVRMAMHGREGKHHKRPTFQELDKNSDGVLSKDEVGGRLLGHFAEFDTDANGTLSAEEFAAVRMAKHHNRPTFQEMDKNSDGILAKEEVGGRLLADFKLLDKDGNGFLSEDEVALPKNQVVQKSLK